jgi:hypothetical protein
VPPWRHRGMQWGVSPLAKLSRIAAGCGDTAANLLPSFFSISLSQKWALVQITATPKNSLHSQNDPQYS